MRRIGLLLTLAAIMAAVVALTIGLATAQTECTKNKPKPGQTTCVAKEQFTEQETRVFDTNTKFRERPGTQECQLANSNRKGTQQGIFTDEVLITTYGVFEITYERTTTTVYQGNPEAGNVVSGPTTTEKKVGEEQIRTFEEEEVVNTTFKPTGKCKNVPGPQ